MQTDYVKLTVYVKLQVELFLGGQSESRHIIIEIWLIKGRANGIKILNILQNYEITAI